MSGYRRNDAGRRTPQVVTGGAGNLSPFPRIRTARSHNGSRGVAFFRVSQGCLRPIDWIQWSSGLEDSPGSVPEAGAVTRRLPGELIVIERVVTPYLVGFALLAATLMVGCQGEDGFSFGAPTVMPDKAAEAKSASCDPCADLPNEQALVRAMLEAVNETRAKHGLRRLRLDPTLTQVADFWACRMIDSGFFNHEDPHDGSNVASRALSFAYAYRKVGENLAAGQASIHEVMADWMLSPIHRANILDPAFTEIGITIKQGGQLGVYWVQEFGRPINADPHGPVDGKPAQSRGGESSDDQPATQPAPGPTPADPANPAGTAPADRDTAESGSQERPDLPNG